MARRPLGISLVVLAVAGCSSLQVPAAVGGAVDVRVAARVPQLVAVTGVVKAPAGILSNNGGSLISDGGGQLIGQTRLYRPLAVEQQVLANTTVFAADGAGKPLPNVAAVKTDAQGRFRLAGVPGGAAFAIVARGRTQDGREVELRTLARAVNGEAPVDAFTTLVTLSILDGGPRSLGDFDAATFAAAVRRTAEAVQELPDLADAAAMRARMKELEGRVQELEQAIDAVRVQAAASPTPGPAGQPTQGPGAGNPSGDPGGTAGGTGASPGTGPTPGGNPTPGTGPTPGSGATPGGGATPVPGPTPSPTGGGAATPTPAPLASPTPAPTATPAAATPTPAPAGLAGTVSTISAGSGYQDGPLASARFNGPSAAVTAGDGTIYVADSFNHRIRKIAPDGTVSTLAGNATVAAVDGTGSAASFRLPTGIALGSDGALYVCDQDAQSIRRVTTAGVVTTLAGNGTTGAVNGSGSAARFNGPYQLAAGPDGALYVADRGNHLVRRVTLAGAVTTLAGAGSYGSVDGTGAAAKFANPSGIAVAPDGTLYVADSTLPRVRVISPAGVVTTLTGAAGTGGADGPLASATFAQPRGLARAADGTLYLADIGNHRIRRITPGGQVTTLAGNAQGSADGTGGAAGFNAPQGLVLDANGRLVVCDTSNGLLRRIQ